ncbi:DnaA ATPase domain-containing protein [Halobacteriovorax sp. HLS]|uniref:DnaA ATPase domain-containing protein n=1 Tax=Halobacteriovorax sp. HLS TaxID=2234000 RepID=UPI000FD6C32D|nr:DnaA/Hda family protein [Halobacteriovorax sp. HLS]
MEYISTNLNKAAYEIIKSFLNNSANKYSHTLTVYGESGSGKSYLLNDLVEKLSRKINIKNITAMKLVREYIKAYKANIVEDLKDTFVNEYDCIVIDDTEYLKRKPGAQEFLVDLVGSASLLGIRIIFITSTLDEGWSDPKFFNIIRASTKVKVSSPDKKERKELLLAHLGDNASELKVKALSTMSERKVALSSLIGTIKSMKNKSDEEFYKLFIDEYCIDGKYDDNLGHYTSEDIRRLLTRVKSITYKEKKSTDEDFLDRVSSIEFF